MKELQKKFYPVYLISRIVGFISWKGFAFTTGITVFVTYSSVKFGAWSPPSWTTWFVVFLIYMVIDHGLENTAAVLMGRPAKDRKDQPVKFFVKVVVALFIFRLCVSGFATFMSSPEIAEGITKDTSSSLFIERIASNDANYNRSLDELKKNLEQARKTENERVKDAKHRGHILVQQAVDTRKGDKKNARDSPWWRKQQSKYIKTWIAGVDKALADSSSMVVYEKGRSLRLQAELDEFVLFGSQRLAGANDNLLALIKNNQDQVRAKTTRRTNMLWVLDLLFIVVGLSTTLIQVKYEQAFGRLPYRNEKSLTFMFGFWMRKVSGKVVDWVEKVLKIDIDGDGLIGGENRNKDNTDPGVMIPIKNPPHGPDGPHGRMDVVLDSTLTEFGRKLTELTEKVDSGSLSSPTKVDRVTNKGADGNLTTLDSQELSVDRAKVDRVDFVDRPSVKTDSQLPGLTESDIRRILSEMMPGQKIDSIDIKSMSTLENALRNSYKRGNPSSQYASKKEETRKDNWNRYLALKSLWENMGKRVVERTAQSLELS